jgi:hypothetical protein
MARGMALRNAMRASASPFIEPGETIQQVLAAMTVHPVGVPLIDLIPVLLVNRYRIVAVTDQRVLVLDTGRWSVKTARAVLTELPRSTRLGPARGRWHKIETGSGNIRVSRSSLKDIDAADALITPPQG